MRLALPHLLGSLDSVVVVGVVATYFIVEAQMLSFFLFL